MTFLNIFGQKNFEKDPYWEFDQSKHFKPKLNTIDFLKSSEYDLGWLVLEPLSNFLKGKKAELTKGKSLSYGQKALYYWWYVDAQVTNGGFTQFYYNDYGKYVPTIIKSLQYIGDYKMAELVNRSYEIYLKENKQIKDARKGGFEEFSNLYKKIKDFDQLDDEYFNLNNETIKIIEEYIRKNTNEFCTNENGEEFDLTFSGELKSYFSNKILNEIIPLLNGKVNGTYKIFYENGNLKDEINYINGKTTGESIEYFENGNIKLAISKSKHPEGFLHSKYHENGNLKSTEVFISKYDRDGKWIKYYENGQIMSETEFINKQFIVQNCWREDGTQILKDGTGLYITENTYWKGFTQRNEQEYLNYKRHGKQYTYDNNKLSLYQEMFEGLENGFTRTYDQEGNLTEESVYKNGNKISVRVIKE